MVGGQNSARPSRALDRGIVKLECIGRCSYGTSVAPGAGRHGDAAAHGKHIQHLAPNRTRRPTSSARMPRERACRDLWAAGGRDRGGTGASNISQLYSRPRRKGTLTGPALVGACGPTHARCTATRTTGLATTADCGGRNTNTHSACRGPRPGPRAPCVCARHYSRLRACAREWPFAGRPAPQRDWILEQLLRGPIRPRRTEFDSAWSQCATAALRLIFR